MNQKYCKICGEIMIAVVMANFWVCNRCHYKECGHADLPAENFSRYMSSSGPNSIGLSATFTATTEDTPDNYTN